MGSVYPYTLKDGAKRYRIVYRGPDHVQTSESGFKRKADAEVRLAEVEVSKAAGAYVSTKDARALVGQLGEGWLKVKKAALKASAYRSLDSAWRVHVEPRWGQVAVGKVRNGDVAAWVAELAESKSATTTLRAYGVLAGVLDQAVKDKRLTSNPARDVDLPRKVSKARVYLTHEQVARLAEASTRPELVFFLAYTGLRWGEATGLKLRHVDPERQRVTVEENAVEVNGKVVVGTPKTHERRSVPYPAFIAPMLAKRMAGKSPDGIVFDFGGRYLRLPNSQNGWLQKAVERCQAADETFPRVTAHDLRHTAASLAISAGANVKAVQRMLGHASAAMTLDVYADLFDDDLDAVAAALDAARSL